MLLKLFKKNNINNKIIVLIFFINIINLKSKTINSDHVDKALDAVNAVASIDYSGDSGREILKEGIGNNILDQAKSGTDILGASVSSLTAVVASKGTAGKIGAATIAVTDSVLSATPIGQALHGVGSVISTGIALFGKKKEVTAAQKVTIEGTIAQLDGRIADLMDKIPNEKEFDKKTSDIKDKIDLNKKENNENVENIKKEIEELKKQKLEQENKLKDLNNFMQDLDKKIENLKTGYEKKYNELMKKIEENKESGNEKIKGIENISMEGFDGISKQVKNMIKESSEKDSEINNLENKFSLFMNDKNKNKINKFNASNEDLKIDVSKIDEFNFKIKDLNDDIIDLKKQIDNLNLDLINAQDKKRKNLIKALNNLDKNNDKKSDYDINIDNINLKIKNKENELKDKQNELEVFKKNQSDYLKSINTKNEGLNLINIKIKKNKKEKKENKKAHISNINKNTNNDHDKKNKKLNKEVKSIHKNENKKTKNGHIKKDKKLKKEDNSKLEEQKIDEKKENKNLIKKNDEDEKEVLANDKKEIKKNIAKKIKSKNKIKLNKSKKVIDSSQD